jgi:hypothetical protein
MFDVFTFVLPAAMGLVGVLVGAGLARRPRLPKAPVLMCSCKHGFGIHKDSGPCQAQVQRVTEWDEYGDDSAFEWVPCGCLVYDGPEPLPRAWTPPSGLV